MCDTDPVSLYYFIRLELMLIYKTFCDNLYCIFNTSNYINSSFDLCFLIHLIVFIAYLLSIIQVTAQFRGKDSVISVSYTLLTLCGCWSQRELVSKARKQQVSYGVGCRERDRWTAQRQLLYGTDTRKTDRQTDMKRDRPVDRQQQG